MAFTLPFLSFAWADLGSASAEAWWAAACLGVVPSALGFVMWGHTVARVPVATSTSLLYLVPAAALVIAYVARRAADPGRAARGLVVIAGVATVSLGDRVLSRMRRAEDLRSGRQEARAE